MQIVSYVGTHHSLVIFMTEVCLLKVRQINKQLLQEILKIFIKEKEQHISKIYLYGDLSTSLELIEFIYFDLKIAIEWINPLEFTSCSLRVNKEV